MAGNKKFYLLAVIVIGVILLIMWESLTQPGVQDLKGNFVETASYRNENNTGPIKRIYSVTVTDTLWEEMMQYGDYMPHTKYGNTTVYFFPDNQQAPVQLNPDQNFDERYNQYCLAKYAKDGMGNVSFIKYPFKPKGIK